MQRSNSLCTLLSVFLWTLQVTVVMMNHSSNASKDWQGFCVSTPVFNEIMNDTFFGITGNVNCMILLGYLLSVSVFLADLVLSNKLVLYDLENQTIGWTEYNCECPVTILLFLHFSFSIFVLKASCIHILEFQNTCSVLASQVVVGIL